ncbi:MAG TPA: hypothetical protein VFX58_04910 [Chitinophagaceae bacterium]|nr:hypothetical protein [Chitinophagaceae bacterium]
MIRSVILLMGLLSSVFTISSAQKIIYSEPDRDDTRRMNFEIAGKINGNFLIYKNVRNRNWISVLNNDMEEIAKVEQDYVPDNDRMINVDFFAYSDFCYMVYQFQKKNIVYCMASRIDGNGKKIGEVIQLDTTQLGFAASNKIYTVLSSEDKSKLIVFKINSRNRKIFRVTSILLNDKLETLKKSRLSIPMEERNELLGEFQLDNEGDLVFTKYQSTNGDEINRAAFVIKYAQADSFSYRELDLDKINLDEIHIKVDNFNKRYFLTSFYYKERRGNVDGFYFYVWDKQTQLPVNESSIAFSDELRKEAKGDANMWMAFNDYFIRNIITRRDGGVIIAAESYYTTSRFNSWNRWNYLNRSYFNSLDYYYYYPYYSSFWGSRWNNNQNVRFHADNIAVFSFNKYGQPEWNNVIVKEQFDDQSDDHISYQVMVTGGQLHFLFNQSERRLQLLNDYSVEPDGKMNRNPTLKNLDKGYEFMPRYAKQVSARQILVPCLTRNYICFAKVDYN